MNKMLLISFFTFILLMTITVFSIDNISIIKKDCVTESIPYQETVLDYYDIGIDYKNGTIEQIPVYEEVTKYRDVTSCSPEYLEIDDKTIEFEKQGYKCSIQENIVICDSKSDGNGDGICSPNGGETCVKIENGVTKIKNSVVRWDEKSAVIPVKPLEAK